jgi:hypothetical protein
MPTMLLQVAQHPDVPTSVQNTPEKGAAIGAAGKAFDMYFLQK